MDGKLKKKLTSIVNASGFVFQLAVERHVKKSMEKHRWSILGREYPWHEPKADESGFIDLILGRGSERIIMECKRTRDAQWVFLLSDKREEFVSRILCQWLEGMKRRPDMELYLLWGYHDFIAHPQSAEAAFCTVRGSGEREKPMLERIAGKLMQSVTSILDEEKNSITREEYARRIYVPVIVTTAKLYVCIFDPGKVPLESGTISHNEDETDIKEVPWVRFRKALATSITEDPGKMKYDRQSTVMVVNANQLIDFLCHLEILDVEPTPWELARQLERNRMSS